MSRTEVEAEAAAVLALWRPVMRHASDREIYHSIIGDIRPPYRVTAEVADDYRRVRAALDEMTARAERFAANDAVIRRLAQATTKNTEEDADG